MTSYGWLICTWTSYAILYKIAPFVNIQLPKFAMDLPPCWSGYFFDTFFLTRAVNFFKWMLHSSVERAHFYWTVTFWLLSWWLWWRNGSGIHCWLQWQLGVWTSTFFGWLTSIWVMRFGCNSGGITFILGLFLFRLSNHFCTKKQKVF